MEEIKKIPAQAIVKVTTSFGACCLGEIKGLKEGTILDGVYCPINKAFDFTFNGEDAMLWIGEDGVLVSLGEGQKYKYMMLSRLLFDCEYFIKQTPYTTVLFYPTIKKHMSAMRQYWKELNIKPEWLSFKQIGRLEHKMNQILTKKNRKFKIK